MREENRFPYFRMRILSRDEEPFFLEDKENNLSYQISYPSDEYLLYLLYKLSKRDNNFYYFIMRRGVLPRLNDDEIKELGILDCLRKESRNLMTLKITSAHAKNLKDYIRYANSLIFHLSYNLDEAIVPQRSLDEFLREGRIRRVRRSRLDEIEAPKRRYHADLVYHYQQAIASDNPTLEYLSYYHISEHFFEAVFNDELNEKVKGVITHPEFSYKRKKDIRLLINEISRSLKSQGDNVTFSEQEALRLTLVKFVDLKILHDQIRAYDDSLIAYYKSRVVDFSDGDTFDIEHTDTNQVFNRLSKRIYKTRNAIVHSKESDKGKYIPFDHDNILIKEIPLLRFCAELIILNSSSLID